MKVEGVNGDAGARLVYTTGVKGVAAVPEGCLLSRVRTVIMEESYTEMSVSRGLGKRCARRSLATDQSVHDVF